MKKNNVNRHLDLSSKIIEMGQALMKEGKASNDYTISQSGTFLILIGGLMFNESDVDEFAFLCSMFSSKKILESLETNDDMKKFMKTKKSEDSYDELIKRIKKFRRKNDEEGD